MKKRFSFSSKQMVPMYAASILIFIAACQPQDNTQNSNEAITDKEQASQGTSYSKPSAPISFRHNYDGETSFGEIESLELTFSVASAGELAIQISGDAGVIQNGEHRSSHHLAAGESVTIPLSVSLPTAEKHYLNIQASIAMDGVQQGKAFSLALVPTQLNPAATGLVGGAEEKTDDGSNETIIMPAEETVREN